MKQLKQYTFIMIKAVMKFQKFIQGIFSSFLFYRCDFFFLSRKQFSLLLELHHKNSDIVRDSDLLIIVQGFLLLEINVIQHNVFFYLSLLSFFVLSAHQLTSENQELWIHSGINSQPYNQGFVI